MNQNLFLLHLTTWFFLTFSTPLFAIEVQDAVVGERKDGLWRTYALTNEGKPDKRFTFTAHHENEFRWDLYIIPSDTFDWANKLSFKEYTEVLNRCVDRFLADVPDGAVWSVHMCITHASKTWQAIRKDLVSHMEKRTGFAVGFPGLDHGGAWLELADSAEIKNIGRRLAKRFKRKLSYRMLDLDYLIMRIDTPEDYRRTWQDIMKLPDLSLDLKSLEFSFNFEPLEKTNKK